MKSALGNISKYFCIKLTIVAVVSVCLYLVFKDRIEKFSKGNEPVYCMMVTGKNDDRIDLARKSVKNFLEQDYPNKHMIIVNHHPSKNVLIDAPEKPKNIKEIVVHKNEKITLGHLRNISLKYVPEGAIWHTWDDDDYRRQDYISLLYNHMKSKKASALMIRNRLEYNVETNSSWGSSYSDGFFWYFMYKDDRYQYEEKETGEDGIIKRNLYADADKKVVVYDNPADIYVRFIHNSNTSRFVKPRQFEPRRFSKKSKYTEWSVNNTQQIFIEKAKKMFLE